MGAPLARGPGGAPQVRKKLLACKKLHDDGLISEAEWERQRRDVLGLDK
jgi:hypothetical protein